MGDGLYFNAMLSVAPAPAGGAAADVEELLAALERLRR
jgi:hypothetical protein